MCYKYATPTLDELLAHLQDAPAYTIQDYYQYYVADAFLHPMMPVTTIEQPAMIRAAQWGLIPSWAKTVEQAKDIASKTLNAVSETIYEKPSFKNYIKSQRCLVWANGFYEWQWKDEKGKNKTPYFIYMPKHEPFSFGGIYSEWTHPETGEVFTTFSIITTEANELMSQIHNIKKRMPLIIQPADREKWLSAITEAEIKELMQPLPDGILQAHTISKLITTRGIDNNVPEVQVEHKDELF